MYKKFTTYLMLGTLCVSPSLLAENSGQDYFHYYEALQLLGRVEAAMEKLSLPVHKGIILQDWHQHRGKGDLPAGREALTKGVHGKDFKKINKTIEALLASKAALSNLEKQLKEQAEIHTRKKEALEKKLQAQRAALESEQKAAEAAALKENRAAEEKRQKERARLEEQLAQAQKSYDAAMNALENLNVQVDEKSALVGRVGKRAEAYRAKIEAAAKAAAEKRAAEEKRLAEAAEQQRLEAEQKQAETQEKSQSRGFFGSVWSLAKSATSAVGQAVRATGSAAKNAAVAVGHRTGIVHQKTAAEQALDDYLQSEGHELERQGLPMIEEHLAHVQQKLEDLLARKKHLIKQVKEAEQRIQKVLQALEKNANTASVKKALTDYNKLLREVDQQLGETQAQESHLVKQLSESMTKAKMQVEALNRTLETSLKRFHQETLDEGGRLTAAHQALIAYLAQACQVMEKDDARVADKNCREMIRGKVEKRIGKLEECQGMRQMTAWHFKEIAACDLAYLKDKHCSRWNSTAQCRKNVIEHIQRGADKTLIMQCEALHSQSLDEALETCMQKSSAAEKLIAEYNLLPLLPA